MELIFFSENRDNQMKEYTVTSYCRNTDYINSLKLDKTYHASTLKKKILMNVSSLPT